MNLNLFKYLFEYSCSSNVLIFIYRQQHIAMTFCDLWCYLAWDLANLFSIHYF